MQSPMMTMSDLYLWIIYQIDGIAQNDLVVERSQIELLYIGLIDLNRRYAGRKAVQLSGLSNDLGIFSGARTDVAYRLGLQQADDALT